MKDFLLFLFIVLFPFLSEWGICATHSGSSERRFNVPAISSYRDENFPSQKWLESRHAGYDLYIATFPSPGKSLFARNNTVWVRFFLPRERAVQPPCVIVLPVLGAPNTWIEERFIKSLLKRRIAAVLVEFPYQFHRRPSESIGSGQGFLARDAERLAANFRQAVLDVRRTASWVLREGRVDPDRLGLLGISLGSIVGATVYSVDSRFKHAVFVLGGARLDELLFRSAMTREYMKKVGIQRKALRTPAWREIEPLSYRENNRGKKALLINAMWDRIVPRVNAVGLAEAFPDSRQMWVPLGHYSSIVHLIWIPRYVSSHFKRKL